MVIGRRSRFGQLVLFLALLFGIATMHTLGHPVADHGSGAAGNAAPPSQVATVSHGHHHAAGPADAAGPANAQPSYAGPEVPALAMDPMSVCLAVLDTFTVVLVAAGLLRTDHGALLAGCHARILRALRPNPPPRKTLLARLSVLRI
ncbi:hypothetical protein FBY35_5569 [Streptomyces sp. SLBN-118]|uniref:hypothetical protein n=1 Tax=Streptomyces sp. SLBN-118 TaxID=2768454 RepID=UPI0011526E25|nr:hypothetical protein [Streptomyces sp. SLBN-118]TQK44088.1 hypothetical protein FBY35_5569 [Streptomyces sp. SLBN-118]